MKVEAVNHDALLRASRRVDWRFLLPEPELGRVACIGETDAELLGSLKVFSEEVIVLASSNETGGQSSFDLVVARNASLPDLEAARALLSDGGWLYGEIELERRSGRVSSRAARSARGYARALRRLGFVDVAAYAHWPDFASCRVLVPLGDPVAVRYGLERRQLSSPGFVIRLAPFLAVTRQLAHFVPCASVLGRMPARGEESR
jgi:hypothetical protein